VSSDFTSFWHECSVESKQFKDAHLAWWVFLRYLAKLETRKHIFSLKYRVLLREQTHKTHKNYQSFIHNYNDQLYMYAPKKTKTRWFQTHRLLWQAYRAPCKLFILRQTHEFPGPHQWDILLLQYLKCFGSKCYQICNGWQFCLSTGQRTGTVAPQARNIVQPNIIFQKWSGPNRRSRWKLTPLLGTIR